MPISEEAVATWTARLRPLILERKATFFEATTALAFADFAARGVDMAVVEVGLGGRLDSTNVLRPLVSGVTKIEQDHMKYLGDTLELIAGEKAGIAKPGVPFVIGETRAELIRCCAGRRERRWPGADAGRGRTSGCCRRTTCGGAAGLAGPHQRRNAAVAHGDADGLAADLPARPDAIERGFGSARVAGRLDRRGRWLFDVAHNPDGMRALVRAIDGLAAHGRSTRWSRSWATRPGPRCWCGSTR